MAGLCVRRDNQLAHSAKLYELVISGKRDVGRMVFTGFSIKRVGTKPLTTHLDGYMQATNSNRSYTGILLFPPPWSLPPWWSSSLTAAVSVQSISAALRPGKGPVCFRSDYWLSAFQMCEVGLGPFLPGAPYRDCRCGYDLPRADLGPAATASGCYAIPRSASHLFCKRPIAGSHH